MNLKLNGLPEFDAQQHDLKVSGAVGYMTSVYDCFLSNFDKHQVLAIADFWADTVVDAPKEKWTSGGSISCAIKWVLDANGVENLSQGGWSVHQEVCNWIMDHYGLTVDSVTPRTALRKNIAARVNLIRTNKVLSEFCKLDDDRLNKIAGGLDSSHEAFGLDIDLLDDILRYN
jgi:hypothetical protein